MLAGNNWGSFGHSHTDREFLDTLREVLVTFLL